MFMATSRSYLTTILLPTPSPQRPCRFCLLHRHLKLTRSASQHLRCPARGKHNYDVQVLKDKDVLPRQDPLARSILQRTYDIISYLVWQTTANCQ